MDAPSKCSECGGALDLGWIPDASYGAFLQLHWHPGAPEKTSFFGLPTGTKVDHRVMYPIVTLRCTKCGLLRFHAPEKPSGR